MKIATWETAMMAAAQALLGTPFEYGQTDCPMVCLLMADAMTGGALADAHRGQWQDRKSGLVYVKRTGNSLEAVLRSLGVAEVLPGFQQPGDFILTINPEGWVRGHVCLGRNVISSDTGRGVALYDAAAILTLPDHRHLILRIA